MMRVRCTRWKLVIQLSGYFSSDCATSHDVVLIMLVGKSRVDVSLAEFFTIYIVYILNCVYISLRTRVASQTLSSFADAITFYILVYNIYFIYLRINVYVYIGMYMEYMSTYIDLFQSSHSMSWSYLSLGRHFNEKSCREFAYRVGEGLYSPIYFTRMRFQTEINKKMGEYHVVG